MAIEPICVARAGSTIESLAAFAVGAVSKRPLIQGCASRELEAAVVKLAAFEDRWIAGNRAVAKVLRA